MTYFEVIIILTIVLLFTQFKLFDTLAKIIIIIFWGCGPILLFVLLILFAINTSKAILFFRDPQLLVFFLFMLLTAPLLIWITLTAAGDYLFKFKLEISGRLFVLVLWLSVVAVLPIFTSVAFQNYHIITRGIRTSGKATKITIDNIAWSSGAIIEKLSVEYQLVNSDKVITANFPQLAGLPFNKIEGQEVQLKYLPENPESVVVTNGYGWLVIIVSWFIMLLGVIILPFVFFKMKEKIRVKFIKIHEPSSK